MIDVVNKFNMVDMGGIDIVESQGVAVEGLFSRLSNAIQNCRYQILYNWKFAKIEIAPSYVELVFDGTRIYINEAVSVTEDDVVHIYSLEPEPIVPVIEPLTVSENGTYEPASGVDGYAPVVVEVDSGGLPEVVLLDSRNARSIATMEHEIEPGDYTILVATTTSLSINDVSVTFGSNQLDMDIVPISGNVNLNGIKHSVLSVAETATLSVSNTATASNSGLQAVVVKGNYEVEFAGQTSNGNDSNSFNMSNGLFLSVYRWGYYQNNNTFPQASVCNVNGEVTAVKTINDGERYFYGGTYSLKLIKGE